MRKRMSMFAVIMGISTAAAAGEQGPYEVPSPVIKIFVPQGFDDNDNVEVIVQGEFPDSCYQIGRTSAQVSLEKKLITVTATSYRYTGSGCTQVVSPFLQSVKLGVLTKGTYKVVFKFDEKIAASLPVSERATESPEDYLYAPVENAYLNFDQKTEKPLLTIQGHFPYMFMGCMVMREVRTKRSSDVLVVQPIAAIVHGEECHDQSSDHSFEVKQSIAEPFNEVGLIHVRVLNGDSLNRLVLKPH